MIANVLFLSMILSFCPKTVTVATFWGEFVKFCVFGDADLLTMYYLQYFITMFF